MSDERISLSVEGMTCNHCASTVNGIIKQEGGKEIHVDYLLGEANFDLANTSKLEKIARRLKSAGYDAKLAADFDRDNANKFSSVEIKFLITLPFSLVLFSHMFVPHSWIINEPWVQIALCLPVFVIGLLHFGKSSLESVKSGNTNMDVLILLGSSSSFIYSLFGFWQHGGSPSVHDFMFFETTSTIITLVLIGYVIEHRAVKQTTVILRNLFKAQPEKAKKLVASGLNQEMLVVNAASLVPNDMILVNTGDRIPADGLIQHGQLEVDESMLTGESMHIRKVQSKEVLAGSLVMSGNATVRITHLPSKSTLSKIIELVKQSRSEKPPIQRLADQISKYFVPAVLAACVLAFFVNYFMLDVDFTETLMRSVAILVIACPCAMGLATPTAVSVGLGIAGSKGIIVKQASIFEELARIQTIVFDKTGTLTTGATKIKLEYLESTWNEDQIWPIIKALEQRSSHPIAQSVLSYTTDFQAAELENVNEIQGKGMEGNFDGKKVRFGSAKYLNLAAEGDLFLTLDDKLIASLSLDEFLKEQSVEVINSLKARYDVCILSGDKSKKVDRIAEQLGISNAQSEQMPEDKLNFIRSLKRSKKVMMVGDGINDSPALQSADVSVSMGTSNALASDSAQIVILSGNLQRLVDLVNIGKKVVSTIRQNLFWAFAYNIVAIPMAALGYLDPMLAALSMAFSDVVVIGNSLRLRLSLPRQHN